MVQTISHYPPIASQKALRGRYKNITLNRNNFIVFANIWERNKFKQIDDKELLVNTEKEIANSAKEVFFWFSQEKIKLIKNPAVRFLHKIIRKINK